MLSWAMHQTGIEALIPFPGGQTRASPIDDKGLTTTKLPSLCLGWLSAISTLWL